MLTKEEYINQTTNQLKELLLNQKVNHRKFGTGTIVLVDSFDYDEMRKEAHVRADVQFTEELKHLALRNSLNNIMTVEVEGFESLLTSIAETLEEYIKAEREEATQLRIKQAEEEKIRKRAEAFQRKKERDLLKLNSYKLLPLTSNPTANFYCALGWIAKHVTRISAAMPDYEESWFRRTFNKPDTTDKSIRIVDSEYRSPAGWQEQWGLGMTIRFRLDKDESIPALLSKYHFNSNAINSVDLVWNLVENYGFDFGRVQDLERIKSSIPDEYLLDFEYGLN